MAGTRNPAEVARKTRLPKNGFWSQAAWVQVPSLPLPSCVPLSEPVNLSVPCFLVSPWGKSGALLTELLWG